MKKTLLIAGALMLAGAFTYLSARNIKPSKNVTTTERSIGAVDELSVSSSISVTYVQTNTDNCRISISAPDNIIDYVVIRNKGEKLYLSLQNGVPYSKEINATVYAPALSEIELSGASRFNAASLTAPGRKIELEVSGASQCKIENLSASTLDIEAEGASSVKIDNISTRELSSEVSGASSVTLSGRADNVDYEVSGASSLHAQSLAASVGKVEATGASSVKCSIKNLVSVESSGVSRVRNNNE